MPNYSTQLKALYDGYVQTLNNMNKNLSQGNKIQIEHLFASLENKEEEVNNLINMFDVFKIKNIEHIYQIKQALVSLKEKVEQVKKLIDMLHAYAFQVQLKSDNRLHIISKEDLLSNNRPHTFSKEELSTALENVINCMR